MSNVNDGQPGGPLPKAAVPPSPPTAEAIQRWVETIGEDTEGAPSPRAIRQHRFYRLVTVLPKELSLPSILRAMAKAPMAAVMLAQDVVGDADSPIQDAADVGRLSRLVARWTQWGNSRYSLSLS